MSASGVRNPWNDFPSKRMNASISFILIRNSCLSIPDIFIILRYLSPSSRFGLRTDERKGEQIFLSFSLPLFPWFRSHFYFCFSLNLLPIILFPPVTLSPFYPRFSHPSLAICIPKFRFWFMRSYFLQWKKQFKQWEK